VRCFYLIPALANPTESTIESDVIPMRSCRTRAATPNPALKAPTSVLARRRLHHRVGAEGRLRWRTGPDREASRSSPVKAASIAVGKVRRVRSVILMLRRTVSWAY